MKVIPPLDVSCLYKQTRQASAILRVQNSDVIRTVLFKNESRTSPPKPTPTAFYDLVPLARVIKGQTPSSLCCPSVQKMHFLLQFVNIEKTKNRKTFISWTLWVKQFSTSEVKWIGFLIFISGSMITISRSFMALESLKFYTLFTWQVSEWVSDKC